MGNTFDKKIAWEGTWFLESLGHKLNIINIFKLYPKCFEI